jgi:DNA-binding FadR family transcriptional regulator
MKNPKYSFYTDGAKKIIAISTYAGKIVRGVAKCDPNDEYDPELGRELAAARCALKIAQKRVERAKEKQADALGAAMKAMNHLKDMEYYRKDAEDSLHEAIAQLKYVTEQIK